MMSNASPNRGRRRLVCAAGCAAFALPAAALFSRIAAAQEQLDPSSPTAAALAYTHDATQSNRPSDDQTCLNCLHYTGDAELEWGPCAIFPGTVVARDGWCLGWVPKS